MGGPLDARSFDRGRDIPLAAGGLPAIVFVLGHETETLGLLKRIYPHASVEAFGPKRADGTPGEPLLHVVRIPAAEIDALVGLDATFEPALGLPVRARLRGGVFDWMQIEKRKRRRCHGTATWGRSALVT